MEKEKRFDISSKLLFQIYLYGISFLTLGVAVIGGSAIINASLSYSLDIPFSYTLTRANNEDEYYYEMKYKGEQQPIDENFDECYSGKPVTYWNTTFCFDNSVRKNDLINGISLFLSMVILFAIHQFVISRIKNEIIIDWLKKIYTFGSLLVYSIASVIAIPTAIYLTIGYLLFEETEYISNTPSAPGMAIAVLIFVLPLWMYFLKQSIKLKEED